MKSICLILGIVLSAQHLKADEMLADTSTKGGLTLTVKYSPAYQTTGDVWIEYLISNAAGQEIRAYKANPETFDMRIELIGPEGERLPMIEELPGSIPRGGSRHHLIVGNAESPFRSTVNLSRYYELKNIGRYRCRISKTCYITESGWKQRSSALKPGSPVQVDSNEFGFEVKAIDEVYAVNLKKAEELRSRLASSNESVTQAVKLEVPSISKTMASEAKPAVSSTSEEPTSSTPWSILVVLIVAALGLLWLLLKRRSGKRGHCAKINTDKEEMRQPE